MGSSPAAMTPASLPVYLASVEPSKRNRLTALIRIIMVIPQYVVLFFVHIAAFVVLIVGWFGALFTGRLPNFAQEFLSGVLRWDTRVVGYLYFLTDEYPPFSLQPEPGYPIQIALPPAGELNRLAVLVRIFIAIPAWVVSGVASSGVGLLSVASWFMIVFTGKQPRPLYEAARVAIRYETRFLAYFFMLTPEYSWGLFGDMDTAAAPSAPTEAADTGWLLRLSPQGRTAMTVLVVLGVLEVILYGLHA
jgi:hypothetical protein